GTGADDLRAAEAAEVAATVREVVAAGWQVGDGPDRSRPARLGDVTILVPARTSLPFLAGALTAARIPYRAASPAPAHAPRAPRALRPRPGEGVARGHRRLAAPVPPLGRLPDRRGRPGGRVGPARDRRRRRADHDHPRRQGPRVPRHDRVGPFHRAPEPARPRP